MSTEKLVYVPRNWKVNYVDETGHDKSIALKANAEYRIVENGIPYNTTIAGIRTEENKVYILAKVMMYPGFMNTMEKVTDRRFCVDNITDIHPVTSTYVKSTRSNRDKVVKEDANIFTFAFDSEKYSQYRISVYAGEFVCLAMRNDNPNAPKHIRSVYGHIIDVNGDKIKVSRYVTSRGIRNVYDYTVDLASLLGIYRYELEISDKVEEVVNDTDVVETTTEVAATTEE